MVSRLREVGPRWHPVFVHWDLDDRLSRPGGRRTDDARQDTQREDCDEREAAPAHYDGPNAASDYSITTPNTDLHANSPRTRQTDETPDARSPGSRHTKLHVQRPTGRFSSTGATYPPAAINRSIANGTIQPHLAVRENDVLTRDFRIRQQDDLMQIATRRSRAGLRQEALWALAETATLFLIFIVAFTGRDAFGDGIKTVLTILSIAAGSIGAFGGLVVGRRALNESASRIGRLAIAGWMLFTGVYTVIHVLS